MRRERQARAGAGFEFAAGLGGRDRGRILVDLRERRCDLRGGEAGAKTREILRNRDTAFADRMLEGFAAEGQRAASRKRAEHHRADYAARLVGGLFHIEADKPLRALRTGLEDLLTAAAAVAHRSEEHTSELQSLMR